MGRKKIDARKRFYEAFYVSESGCWIWKLALCRGYGILHVNPNESLDSVK